MREEEAADPPPNPCRLVIIGVAFAGAPGPILVHGCVGDCPPLTRCMLVSLRDDVSRRSRTYCSCGSQRMMVNPPPPPPLDCHLELRSKPNAQGVEQQFAACAPRLCQNGEQCVLKVTQIDFPPPLAFSLFFFECGCV